MDEASHHQQQQQRQQQQQQQQQQRNSEATRAEKLTSLPNKKSAIIVNAHYYRWREIALGADSPYELATRRTGSNSIGRFEALETREYKSVYRIGGVVFLRERDAPDDAYAVASSAVLLEDPSNVASVKLKTNLRDESLAYTFDPYQVHSSKIASADGTVTVASGKRNGTSIMLDLVVQDRDAGFGVGGLIVAAHMKNDALFNVDDPEGNEALSDPDPRPRVVQPGVVYCSASQALAPEEVEAPNYRVAVISSRHVAASVIGSHPDSCGISNIFSMAWPEPIVDSPSPETLDRTEPVIVVPRATYREAMRIAKNLANQLSDHLVRMGTAKIEVVSAEPGPSKKNEADRIALGGVNMAVLIKYVRVLSCDDLLFDSVPKNIFRSGRAMCCLRKPGSKPPEFISSLVDAEQIELTMDSIVTAEAIADQAGQMRPGSMQHALWRRLDSRESHESRTNSKTIA